MNNLNIMGGRVGQGEQMLRKKYNINKAENINSNEWYHWAGGIAIGIGLVAFAAC